MVKPAPLMFAALILALFVLFLLVIEFWNQLLPGANLSPGRT